MPMFFFLVIVFLLGLVGLVLVVSTAPGVGSLVGLSLVVVSLFGALGGGSSCVFSSRTVPGAPERRFLKIGTPLIMG